LIGGAKYLLMQAWLVPVITHLLTALIKSYLLILNDFLPFLPGISVGVAHLLILLLVMMNVPSLSAMMFKVSIKKQRKNLNKMIKSCHSEEHRKVLTEKLEALDLEELNFQDVQIESSKNLQKSELGEKK